MSSESPRIAELRRRVESDPSSIAFAQLAEEYRRAGNYEAAERYCRTGLARHPAYLSARVTLGRTLIELNKLDEAEQELQQVLSAAPDNLAALRGVADIHQRLGQSDAALRYYRQALLLSRNDPELEELVQTLSRTAGPVPAASASQTDTLVDFDELLESLGMSQHAAPPLVETLLTEAVPASGDDAAALPAAGDARPVAAVAEDFDATQPDWMRGPLPDLSGSLAPSQDGNVATQEPDAARGHAGEGAGEPDVPSVARETSGGGVPFDPHAAGPASSQPPPVVAVPASAAGMESFDPEEPAGSAGPAERALEHRAARDQMILEELEAWLEAIKR